MTGRQQVQRKPGGGKNRGGGRGGHGSQYAGPKVKSKPPRGPGVGSSRKGGRDDWDEDAVVCDASPRNRSEPPVGRVLANM